MKLAVVTRDSIVSNVLEAAAALRGHQCMTLSSTARLGGALPFHPSVIIVSLDRFESSADLELLHARTNYPDASIMVTAEYISPTARSAALRAGVVDVIQVPYNPFDLITLAEHWQARQPVRDTHLNTCQAFDLEVDPDAYIATKNGAMLHLTRLELRLLYCLCEHFPNVAAIERLLSFGWGQEGEPDTYILRTHMSHLRTRLKQAGGVPLEIASRHSIGYVLIRGEK